MKRSRLLALSARLSSNHLLRVSAEIGVGVIMLTGAVRTVIDVVPTIENRQIKVSTVKDIAPKVTPKVVPAKPVAQPTVVTTPAPAPTVPQPTVTTVTTPKTVTTPVAVAVPATATQSSPGKSVQKLTPNPTQSTSSSSSQSSSSSSSSSINTSSSSNSGDSNSNSSNESQPADATGGYKATNWAGYTVLNKSFTAVSGSWTVPTVTGNSSNNTGDAAWIGIGGVSANDLIQVGTTDNVNTAGAVSDSIFYELLPAAAMEVSSFTVNAGDVMTATIKQTTTNVWSISITDETSDRTYSTTVNYTSSYSSAEWIEEDPSYANGSLVPFDTFTHIIFTGSSATAGGVAASLTSDNASPITLDDNSGNALATPSVVDSTGSTFWVSRN
jgi:hypothetical protein